MMDKDDLDFYRQLNAQDREALFHNEAFLIGMLQAVSGAAVFAILNQFSTLLEKTGKFGLLLVLTLLIAALACAVFAAYFKHQYKMWDLKAPLGKEDEDKQRKKDKYARSLRYMRQLMIHAARLMLAALLILIIALWANNYDFGAVSYVASLGSDITTKNGDLLKVLVSAGLALNLAGVLFLFWFGMPFELPIGKVIVTDGEDKAAAVRIKRNRMLGGIGLVMIVAGTILQIFGVWSA